MKRILIYSLVSTITIALFLLGAWLLIKNEVVHFSWTDQLIREYKYQQAKNSSGKKVLILGDSQLEKWPMSHCLYKDLEEFFEEQGVAYLNAAHHGFGPIEYENQLSKVIPYYKPDIIFIYYYAGNDLGDVVYRENDIPKKRTYEVIFEEGMDKINSGSSDNETEGNSESQSPTNAFDWEMFQEKGIDPEIIQYARNRLKNPNAIGPEYVNPHILNMGIWQPESHFDNCTVKSASSKYGWYLSLQKFEGIMQMADSIKATVNIVVIPSNVQVDTSHYSFYRKANFHVSDELLFSNSPQHILYEFSRDSRIGYLDLLPHFKSHDQTKNLYFENDDHLSEAGHIYAFERSLNFLFEAISKDTLKSDRDRKQNIFLKYEKWLVDKQIEIIKSDSIWYKSIQEKAGENQIPLDSQLILDARYILNNK